MPLYPPTPGTTTATPMGSMGILATTPGAISNGYSWTYTASAKTFPAYTPIPVSTAYAGGLLDLLSAARLADLNALRAAVENLRVFTENLAKQHNQISLDLAAAGLISQ
jgi:hypothetical protein